MLPELSKISERKPEPSDVHLFLTQRLKFVFYIFSVYVLFRNETSKENSKKINEKTYFALFDFILIIITTVITLQLQIFYERRIITNRSVVVCRIFSISLILIVRVPKSSFLDAKTFAGPAINFKQEYQVSFDYA